MTEVGPAGRPDTARPVFLGPGEVVAVRFYKAGGVQVMGPADPLLTVRQIAEKLGIGPATWRNMVKDGQAPRADEPDLERVANQRRPRWRESTVDNWHAARPGTSGAARTRPRDARGRLVGKEKPVSATMQQVKEISGRIEEITGTAPYAYTSEPGDGQIRIVFQHRMIRGTKSTRGDAELAALTYVQGLLAECTAPGFDQFGCHGCAQEFTTAEQRDTHERQAGHRRR